MQRALVAVIVLTALALECLGQRVKPAQAVEDESAANRASVSVPSKAKAMPKTAGSTPRSYSYADWELWRNITIGPGQSINLDSYISFSTADTARVSVRSVNTDLPYLEMNAYWTVPLADYYNVADVVTGESFPYRNVGGATFNSYGSQFRLRLTNTGTSNMFLSQVMIFARVW